MSFKDKGNELFRNGKFQQAIKHYELYLAQDANADKAVAYTNISFCHYKMKQYKDSLEAAENAIEEDQTYAKAYFRKMHAYMEIGNNDYNVYINALLLLKCQPIEEKYKLDTQAIAKQYKQKWLAKLNQDKTYHDTEQLIYGLVAGREQNYQQQKQQPSTDGWLLKWSQQGASLQQQWQQVEEQIVKDQKYGFNLAFLFLNQLQQPNYDIIYQKIKDMQNTMATKMQIESGDQKQPIEDEGKSESKESNSSDQNLFSSPGLNGKKNSNANELQNLKKLAIKDERIKQEQPKQQRRQQSSYQTQRIKKQEMPIGNANQSVEVLYNKFKIRLQAARDVIVQLLKIVEDILSSALQGQTKRQLIDLIRERKQKEIKLMRTSFSKPQQQKVRDLLISNHMQEYMSDFASRHAVSK